MDDRLEKLQNAATAILREIHGDQLRMLGRLGVSTESPRHGEAMFYRMLARGESAATRTKLSRAWRRIRDARMPELIDVVDAMTQIRHRRSRERGHDTALAETLRRCRVSAGAAQSYLDRYLAGALASHAALEADVRRAVGATGDARDHFGHYVRTIVGGASIPRFNVDDCLEFVSSVAERVFGLAITPVREDARVTFQDVYARFHRFGHTVDDLLNRDPPLERSEDLSMWFEKWVYHPQFAERLNLSPEERDGLALCHRLKLLEFRRACVDRAVMAALDFDVHRRAGVGLRESFEALDARFGVSRFCDLGDFPVYFTWPMFQANAGANFGHLWGLAASAAKFRPFLTRRIEEAESTRERDLVADLVSDDSPDPDAAFTFYEDAR